MQSEEVTSPSEIGLANLGVNGVIAGHAYIIYGVNIKDLERFTDK